MATTQNIFVENFESPQTKSVHLCFFECGIVGTKILSKNIDHVEHVFDHCNSCGLPMLSQILRGFNRLHKMFLWRSPHSICETCVKEKEKKLKEEKEEKEKEEKEKEKEAKLVLKNPDKPRYTHASNWPTTFVIVDSGGYELSRLTAETVRSTMIALTSPFRVYKWNLPLDRYERTFIC